MTADRIKEFMKACPRMTREERDLMLISILDEFGDADLSTQEFRDQCEKHGFRAVFRFGLSCKQTLAILTAPETQRALADA